MKQWTEAAEQEFRACVARWRPDAEQGEQSPESLRAEAEALLDAWGVQVVDSADVRRAMQRLGHPATVASRPAPRPRRRWVTATGWGWLLFAATILPCVTLGVELTTGMCAGGFFDPLPTWLHAALVGSVPAFGLYVWTTARRAKLSASNWALVAGGCMMGISAPYAAVFLPLTPLGFMALAFVWYFGAGFIGLLPLSPLIAFVGGAQLTARVAKLVPPGGRARSVLVGAACGVTAVLLATGPIVITRIGLAMTASDDPRAQARGIRLLRRWSSAEELGTALVNPGWGDDFGIVSGIGMDSPGGATAAAVFYRVTGKPFYQGQWGGDRGGLLRGRSREEGFEFDNSQGSDAVGGLLSGLALGESRVDGVIDAESGFAYLEWILVFRNTWGGQRDLSDQRDIRDGAPR